jgi:bifunctional polynucleotide phosphatase/kinase
MAAEYAKSAKSSCKGCSKNIGKNVLRLGFPGKANFGATAWYHYECIWTDFENLKSIDTSKSLKSIIDGQPSEVLVQQLVLWLLPQPPYNI